MNNLQLWQTIGAVVGGLAALVWALYGVVTVPILRLLKDSTEGTNRALGDVSKRIDGIDQRLDRIEGRLARIESKLDNHSERITRLEERTAMVHP